MSPSRLDPPRAAILPTSVLGNNNSVLIPGAHVRVAKRKIVGCANPRVFNTLCIEKATARQPSANISVTTTRLPRPSRRKQRIKPFVLVARSDVFPTRIVTNVPGRDDFHVVPFFERNLIGTTWKPSRPANGAGGLSSPIYHPLLIAPDSVGQVTLGLRGFSAGCIGFRCFRQNPTHKYPGRRIKTSLRDRNEKPDMERD